VVVVAAAAVVMVAAAARVVVVVVPVDIHFTLTFVPCTYKPNLLYELHKAA
jgi:hypothetical protein